VIICKDLNDSNQITSLDEWKSKCPPEKGDIHWKDNRSAKELAKEWILNNGSSLKILLRNCNTFKGTDLLKASPELETLFDKYGMGRKHDLLIIGQQHDTIVVISIEAKVDENFGNYTVGEYYAKGILKKLNGVKTKVPDRIEKLIDGIFKKPYSDKIQRVQCQLLHAVAGTLVEAKKNSASRSLFVVQTFATGAINQVKYKANSKALDDFVHVISSGSYRSIKEGHIIGPFHVNGNESIPSDIPLYMGKIKT